LIENFQVLSRGQHGEIGTEQLSTIRSQQREIAINRGALEPARDPFSHPSAAIQERLRAVGLSRRSTGVYRVKRRKIERDLGSLESALCFRFRFLMFA
jgi:hypothetical protein